jgi:hypothetical protein
MRPPTTTVCSPAEEVLDHSSLATTAVYLRKLDGRADAYGAKVGAMPAGCWG